MVSRAQYSELLANIRNALALMLRDAESFHEASTVLEHIGQVLAAQIRRGLGDYRDEILSLAGQLSFLFQSKTNVKARILRILDCGERHTQRLLRGLGAEPSANRVAWAPNSRRRIGERAVGDNSSELYAQHATRPEVCTHAGANRPYHIVASAPM